MQPCNGLIGFPCLDASHRGTEFAMMPVRSFGLMLGTAMLLAIPVLATVEGGDRTTMIESEPRPPTLAAKQLGTASQVRLDGAGLVPARSAAAVSPADSLVLPDARLMPHAEETMHDGRGPEARRIMVDKL